MIRPRPSCLLLRSRLLSTPRLYSTPCRTSDGIPVNVSDEPTPTKNVSESNALPISAQGIRDAPIQEYPDEGERQRQMQAPNRAGIWSRSQRPRNEAMSGPRFEQTIMGLQVSCRTPFDRAGRIRPNRLADSKNNP